jgi:hypothetical protein
MNDSIKKIIEKSATGLVVILIGIIFTLIEHYYKGYMQTSQSFLNIIDLLANSSIWITMGFTYIILYVFFEDKIKKPIQQLNSEEIIPSIKKQNIKISIVAFCLILIGIGTIVIIDTYAPTWKTYSKFQLSFNYHHSMVVDENSVNGNLFSSTYGQVTVVNDTDTMALTWSKNPNYNPEEAIFSVTEAYKNQSDSVKIQDKYLTKVSGFDATCQEYLVSMEGNSMSVYVSAWYDEDKEMAYLFIASCSDSSGKNTFTHILDSINVKQAPNA